MEYTRQITPVSRWIRIDEKQITPRHSLYYYADKDENAAFLSCFRYRGRIYALNQFLARFGIAGFDKECKQYPPFISGYDGDGDLYNPLLCRLSEDGEKIRLYLDTTPTRFYHL